MIIETRPMQPAEMAPGTYVCVAQGRPCSPHITIASDGVWVRSPDPDPLNPGSHVYSSAHRACAAAWAAREGAVLVSELRNGRYEVTYGGQVYPEPGPGTRTDALALAECLEAWSQHEQETR